ncbi:PROTEIN TIME FOR COFFEE [Salix viminalis]|uniref:PROTEIN TIME FOR COFFEE n=1 Tax=Salix viminalis TaxID=40686 RepID=A0A9Q0Z507_SALVM|nr:PROTEIN TIME FOR COFFEE [Salix viminalis]
MDRNREARRVGMAASNGLPRRRHRSSSLRDSPEDDGPVELQETTRLRDRKKDRDRDRDRDREKDRDRDRISGRSKRRRGERMMHGSIREDGERDESSDEESINDDEDEDDDDAVGVAGSSMRMLPPNPSSLSSSMSNHHHRKSFPPQAKVFRATHTTTNTTAAVTPWKAPDEMIGVSVPRKARSASTKRSHECWTSSGGVGSEQIHRESSISPVRPSGQAMLASASPAAPSSPPSSSNASVKKKMKPNGPKQRPPKSSSKSSSSAQDEIEFEIAEVLYGLLRQPQGATKQESMGNDSIKFDFSEANHNKTTSDAKSRVSSPISNSQSTVPQSSLIPPSNSSCSAAPMSAIAPKRKRPRPVKYDDEHTTNFPARNSSIFSMAKVDIDQPAKTDSSNLENNSGSAAENGGVSHDLMANQAAPATTEAQLQEVVKLENHPIPDCKPTTEGSECRDLGELKEETRSPKKESTSSLRLDDDCESLTANKANMMVSEIDSQREVKFQIDLMAPPPSRSSPERDSKVDFVAVDLKSMVTDGEMEKKPVMVKEDLKALKVVREDINVEPVEKKTKITGEEVESQKPIVNKERNIDLQLDLGKADGDSATVAISRNKLLQQPNTDKIAQSSSLPLPMSMTGWPGGLPHMGYMAPLQGVVSMDGSTASSAAVQPPHIIFSQPRPKRCATHCYIARNIQCHQQFTRMNSFWPPAAGSALQHAAKACNMNGVPSTDLNAGRGVNYVQEKGQGLSIFPGPCGKEKNSQAANFADAAQRKQILLQQALPPGAPGSILHGPTFIFPLNQQQAAAAAAAAASVRSGSVKSPAAAGSAASSSASSSASMSTTVSAIAGPTPMSFNYPSLPGNETQYLAFLQNGAFPIPIPAHVGAATAYRGTHPQAMPLFNGSFYPSQMLHPSQLPQQQQPSTQTQQSQQGHQNPSITSGSSSSQKHLQNHQQRLHGSGGSGDGGNLQGFPGSKNQLPHSLSNQQRQQMQNQNISHQARQLESELGGEDSPSTADSRVSRPNTSLYGQNLMAIHPANFALMNPTSMGGARSASGNTGEKNPQQSQTQVSKAGAEPSASQAFAMSFTSINGTNASPGLDISSIAQNHALLQSLPEAARHEYHLIAAAQAAQQKKNYRVSEDAKTGGNDTSNVEEERKAKAGGKAPLTAGQSIVFSRADLMDSPVSTMPVNTVIDSSAQTLNLGSTPARTARSFMSATINGANATSTQQQKQQQFVAAASTRGKTPATSNGSAYPDHISSSAIATKFPNALSAFPQNFVQNSSSPAQSPQWKNSARTTTSQVPSPSLTPASSTHKNLPQQGRTQGGHSQLSFAAIQKPSASPQGQPNPSSNQSLSPPMMAGSPTTSFSKSAGGSPRTSTSTSNKGGQSSTLSSHQSKNSASVPVQKSSPVGGRNIPSILGHPHNNSSSNSGTKPQLSHQQPLSKHALQQAQLMYTNACMQAQAQHAVSSTNTTPAGSGFYLQRHRSDQQQSQGASATSSTGLLSLCSPVTLAFTSSPDPAKAAANNMKGGGLTSQGLIHAQFAAAPPAGKPHQILSAGFPYVHPVPAAVQVKPAEKKQPAGE